MVALAQVRRREKGSIFGGSLDRPAYRPSSPLLAVLDVPVLDLHYGSVLARSNGQQSTAYFWPLCFSFRIADQCGQYFTGFSVISPLPRFAFDMVASTVWCLSMPLACITRR